MSDTKYDIKCPACGNLMKKLFIDEKFFIDVCTEGCGGAWFDNRELEKMTSENSDYTEILKVYNSLGFIDVDKNAVRKCPICHSKMVKNQPAPNVSVTIDECYTCGGKFLDKGEFEAIIKNKQENIDSLVQYLLNNENGDNKIYKEKVHQLLYDLTEKK